MTLIVSCYTETYREEAKGLIETLEKFDLEHRVEEVPSLGNWDLNTKLKATFIKKALIEQEKPVVWLDADARVIQYPELFFNINSDFACYLRKGTELLSGTLYFANNTKTHEIVDHWISLNQKRPKIFDQRNLHDVIRKWEKDIDWYRLPSSYCLFDLILEDGEPNDPVIWHRQASRRLKWFRR